MNFIEELADEGDLEVARFAYDAASDGFLVNDQPFPLAVVRDNFERFEKSILSNLQAAQITDLSSLNLTFFNMFATPKFFDWLTTSDGKQAVSEVPEVTHRVFNLVYEKQVRIRGKDLLHGFGSAFLREGHVTLSTIGSCACLGVAVDGHLVSYREWGSKYAEYEFHNIDFPAQKISLLAGLGHLAHLSDKSA